MLRLYNTALIPLRLAEVVWATWRSRHPEGRREWAERRARRLPSIRPGGAWIHGASVGEARIVRSLARRIRDERPGLPLAVSAYTRTGRSQLPEPPEVDAAFFVPLDFPGRTRRLLEALRPAALALVETELWPNLLHETHAAGVPLVVLNGRLSEKRMARYRRLRSLYRPLMARVHRLGAQTAEDAARFVELGAPERSIVVTGSAKYDLPEPETAAGELRRRLRLDPARPVFVAGSTGPGEEIQVLEAYEQARSATPDLLLVLAPRHPERADEVQTLARSLSLRVGRHSDEPPTGQLDVLLVDGVGHLPALYQLAWVAFVGGSLIPAGGHNLLEPAAVGVPVLFGPHTESVGRLAQDLLGAGGGLRVLNSAQLGALLERLLLDGELRARTGAAAEQAVRSNRGAMERNVAMLLEALSDPETRHGIGAA